MPKRVLTSVTASAPPSRAAAATSGSSGVVGLSFAHRGRRQPAVASITDRVAVVEWANMCRRSSRLGQERFTSTATTSLGARASRSAAARYSSTERPQMLATMRAPVPRSAGRSSSNHAATPGPWSPTALSIPAVVGCRRGAGFPSQGKAASDFTTTAPRPDRSR